MMILVYEKMTREGERLSDPQFISIEIMRNCIVTNQKLIVPLIDENDKIVACFQVLLKSKQNPLINEDESANLNLALLKIMTLVIQTIMNKLIFRHESIQRKQEVLASTEFTSKISSVRSLKDLIHNVDQLLPKLLGFKHATVLIQDKTAQELFSVPLIKDDKGKVIHHMIRFPQTLGVAGHVFETGKMYICNEASNDK